ncbi:MAG: M20/M25/M40 family metallo-hydrolase, partial [Candidatus Acidiferrales bacterium]
ITGDGYLRVQRLPQWSLPQMFTEMYAAQPVWVRTSGGARINGVVVAPSIHLTSPGSGFAKLTNLDEMYIDVGASSAAEVRKAGIDGLNPVSLNRRLMVLGSQEFAGPSVADKYGAAALIELLKRLDPKKVNGTLTVAFVVQQMTGARGLQRILSTQQADEMIYVGRLLPGGPIAGAENMHRAPRREPGSGVLLGVPQADGELAGFASELKKLADANNIPSAVDYSADLIPRSYLPPPAYPAKWAHLGIAAAWPETPAETINSTDLQELVSLLGEYAGGLQPATARADKAPAETGGSKSDLPRLIELYGVSDHEAAVRKFIQSRLPAWARPETDDAGNLILQAGTAPAGSKAPKTLIVAHMDEIGYEVKSVSKDGRLELTEEGGGEPSFFLGHPALVHSANGDHDAVMELPDAWERPDFDWEGKPGMAIRADVGARSPEEVARMGIQVGDSVTIPKAYRKLLGTRANGRSFDDRVGDAALLAAVQSLGGPLKNRDVTFVWSTGEELGLVGAAKLAKRLAADGNMPAYVFAVDTFVSSDSPIESKRFGDALVGNGFVIRAVDNSNIVPGELVEKLLRLARANQIPAQYGVTGGGNDGSAFVRYGATDIALGWPLRYSHSPAEVIDTRDATALGRIIAAIAKGWD